MARAVQKAASTAKPSRRTTKSRTASKTETAGSEDASFALHSLQEALEKAPNYKASDAELVKLLESPSARRRMEAQRALVRKGVSDPAAKSLMQLAEDKAKPMEARVAGNTHRLTAGDELIYETPDVSLALDRRTLAPLRRLDSRDLPEGFAIDLRSCATLYALLRGLRDSAPHLPWACESVDKRRAV